VDQGGIGTEQNECFGKALQMRVTDLYDADETARQGMECLQLSALLARREGFFLDTWQDRERTVVRVRWIMVTLLHLW